MKKYGSCAVWKAFNDLFDYLPFASVINDQIFCVHGGLSPNADTLNNIRNIDKLK
jgi:diadenosine tetraphosphatase ApaH/serine/threonine PP2A family protein phosphatase